MPESRFDRNEERYPEIHHFKLSRKSIRMKEIALMNLYSKEFNNKFDARITSSKSQETQYPKLNDYSKFKQLDFKTKNNSMSQMNPKLSIKNARKGLGHDLDQLTKGNQHEVNLFPHPSLTIMVQPNKIDYTERSMYTIVVIKLFFHVLNMIEFQSFATTHYDETYP